jgi:anti-sigma B factor antagonist
LLWGLARTLWHQKSERYYVRILRFTDYRKRGYPVPLEITQRETNGIYLLTLKGRLVLGLESNGLRTTVDNLLSSGATRIVVNLEHVNSVDSAGLGSLIEIHRKTKAKDGRLMLTNLGPKLRQALEIARLLTIFETFATEADAVASF